MPHIRNDDKQPSHRDHFDDGYHRDYYQNYDDEDDDNTMNYRTPTSRPSVTGKRLRYDDWRKAHDWSSSSSLISPSSSFSPKSYHDEYHEDFFHDGVENDGWYEDSAATRKQGKPSSDRRYDYQPSKRHRADTSRYYRFSNKDTREKGVRQHLRRKHHGQGRRKERHPNFPSHHAKHHEKKKTRKGIFETTARTETLTNNPSAKKRNGITSSTQTRANKPPSAREQLLLPTFQNHHLSTSPYDTTRTTTMNDGTSIPSSLLFPLVPTDGLLYQQHGLTGNDLIAAAAAASIIPTTGNNSTNLLSQLPLPMTSVADSRRRLLEDLHALKMNASLLSLHNQSYMPLFGHQASLPATAANVSCPTADAAALLGNQKEASAMLMTSRMNPAQANLSAAELLPRTVVSDLLWNEDKNMSPH